MMCEIMTNRLGAVRRWENISITNRLQTMRILNKITIKNRMTSESDVGELICSDKTMKEK